MENLGIPFESTRFQLPETAQQRLQTLLSRQEAGEELTARERKEAEGLLGFSELLSLLHLHARHAPLN
ncbi:hypothetical protein [Gloeobacter violaceus]|uniref:Gsr2619 protein n=1 Tax=Gloeobacter violaceus (strain ATCC 29082 / PCC 7421) TaxID=251221 RepID=Q7NHB8_GLOVI|nr:hypothetical protein [Gloeobacter violaceus]BAC90560.1 gsr2619 [Gloeobacter violaceus PCC 7421]